MRKTILAIATIVTLTIGNTFAQRYDNPRTKVIDARADNAYEEFKINNRKTRSKRSKINTTV
jgi:hypothetical protein